MSPAKQLTREQMIDSLAELFPDDAIKTRPVGNGNRARYIPGHAVIRRLNRATGNQWDLAVKSITTTGNLVTAHVALTIPGLGTREHIGVQQVSEKGGEDLVKGAITDALKKAATLFGVGLELSGEDYEDPDALYQAQQQQPQSRGNAAQAKEQYQQRQQERTQGRQPTPAVREALANGAVDPNSGELKQPAQGQQRMPDGPAPQSAKFRCTAEQAARIGELRKSLGWSIDFIAQVGYVATGMSIGMDKFLPPHMAKVIAHVEKIARIRSIAADLGWTANDAATEIGKITGNPVTPDALTPEVIDEVLAHMEDVATAAAHAELRRDIAAAADPS